MKNWYFFLLLFLIFAPLSPFFSSIIAWDSNVVCALGILEQVQLEKKLGGMTVQSGFKSGHMRTEDIILGQKEVCQKLFVRFDKKKYDSHIMVSIVDTLGNVVISSNRFEESGEISYEPLIGAMRLCLVIEIFGEDVVLHKAGIYSVPREIMKEEDFIISSNFLHKNIDILETSLKIQEVAEVSLFIYDSTGNICHRFLNKEVLDFGSYKFSWNPRSIKSLLCGETFYVWIHLKNFQNEATSYFRTFFVV